MMISKRLTRAGLAFTVFGLCASLLPNSATAITGADACNNGSSNGGGVSGFVADNEVAIAAVGTGVVVYVVTKRRNQDEGSGGSGGSGGTSALPTPVASPAAPAVSETAQRQQIQQLKGLVYNGQ